MRSDGKGVGSPGAYSSNIHAIEEKSRPDAGARSGGSSTAKGFRRHPSGSCPIGRMRAQSLALPGEPTLPGVQEKISAAMISLPARVGRASAHILKLNPPDRQLATSSSLPRMHTSHRGSCFGRGTASLGSGGVGSCFRWYGSTYAEAAVELLAGRAGGNALRWGGAVDATPTAAAADQRREKRERKEQEEHSRSCARAHVVCSYHVPRFGLRPGREQQKGRVKSGERPILGWRRVADVSTRLELRDWLGGT
jgi:hypothetical protein